MLDLIILIILAAGLVVGLKRGFIVQVLHLTSFIIALIVAYIYYKPLAEKFVLWIPYPGVTDAGSLAIVIDRLDLDRTFYQVLAFALIFFVVKFALQILASIFDFLAYLPVLKSLNKLLGAALGFIEYYLLLFIVLYVLVLLPLDFIQSRMSSSILAKLILEHTPIITKMFQHWWYIYVG